METIVRRDEGTPAKLPLIQDKQSCEIDSEAQEVTVTIFDCCQK
jgi:hypothetical protein